MDGYVVITSCPMAWLKAWVPTFLMLSDLFKRGALPVAGGVLDQTQWMLDAHQFFMADETRMRSKSDPWGSALRQLVDE